MNVVAERLVNQRLVARAGTPSDVVRWLGAVQAQDWAGALWGIGLRAREATEADVERAVARREIVRTWPMRGTLHFVAAEDARWMTRLLAPRVLRRAARRYQELELDERSLARGRAALERALRDGGALTRAEAYEVLARAGVSPAGQRGVHVLAHAAMRGAICFGARRGKQPTVVLFDEWVARSRDLDGDEALADLARRYFASHGPATLRDFAWWTGLSLGEARRAADAAGRDLTANGDWLSGTKRARATRDAGAHLLPSWDEYAVAYRDRSAILDAAHAARTRNGIFSPVAVVGGRIAGTWRRATKRDHVALAIDLVAPVSRTSARALEAAARRYGAFLGVEVTAKIARPPPSR